MTIQRKFYYVVEKAGCNVKTDKSLLDSKTEFVLLYFKNKNAVR